MAGWAGGAAGWEVMERAAEGCAVVEREIAAGCAVVERAGEEAGWAVVERAEGWTTPEGRAAGGCGVEGEGRGTGTAARGATGAKEGAEGGAEGRAPGKDGGATEAGLAGTASPMLARAERSMIWVPRSSSSSSMTASSMRRS